MTQVPDVNISTESDDLTGENWFSSTRTSFDGSSVNSIPWAEDVVKQNKDTWDRIERWFYGEEPLPADDKLRNEIVEWTTQFPHIRVVGAQASIYYGSTAKHIDSSYEELIAMHPLAASQMAPKSVRVTRNLEQVLEDSLHIDIGRREKSSALHNLSAIARHKNDGDIEKCMRITSGVLLSKRYPNPVSVLSQDDENRSSARTSMSTAISGRRKTPSSLLLAPIPSSIRVIRIRKDSFDDIINNRILLEPIHVTKSEPISLSARLIKIPDIPLGVGEWHNSGKTNRTVSENKIRIATASAIPAKRPLRTSLTLPAINLMPTGIFADSSGRSISAMLHQNNAKIGSRQVPCKSASKLRLEIK